jgi:hypothetical protein
MPRGLAETFETFEQVAMTTRGQTHYRLLALKS